MPRRTALLLAIAALAGAAACGERPAGEAPAPRRPEPPALDIAKAPAICPVRGPTRLRRLSESAAGPTLEPDPRIGAARIAWRGDLNGDRVEDLLLDFPEACGNWGECPWAVLAGCEGEVYAELWGPEYAVELRVGEAPEAAGWRELVRTVRLGAAGPAAAVEERLRFSGAAYEIAP